MSTHARSEAGLTLIELLVTLVVLGLLLGMLFGALRLGAKTWEMSGRYVQSRSQMEAVHNFLRQSLSQAQPFLSLDERGQIYPVWRGHPESLRFVAPMPEHIEIASHARIAIGLAKSGRRSRLIATWTPYYARPAARSVEDSREVILADDVAVLSLAYFGTVSASEPPRWYEAWEELPGLPFLVRMRVVLTDGRSWPELIVALRLADGAS